LPGLDCVSVGLDPLGVNPHPDCLSPAVGASVPASMRTPPLP
jgi:hypothetical protein